MNSHSIGTCIYIYSIIVKIAANQVYTWWCSLKTQFFGYEDARSGARGKNPNADAVKWKFFKDMEFIRKYRYQKK